MIKPALLAFGLMLGSAAALTPHPASAHVAIRVGVRIAPPPLPAYVQPPIPRRDYIWTPGYWAWSDFDDDYYWVPGVWVHPPRAGYLWTPAWWGWGPGGYFFHAGFWGPHIGFYGGIVYGFGYDGWGYDGCYWRRGHVVYNRAVNNVVNIKTTNVYDRPVKPAGIANASFHGGNGGVSAQATVAQQAALRESHIAATREQLSHEQIARGHHELFAGSDRGAPGIAAPARSELSGHRDALAWRSPDYPGERRGFGQPRGDARAVRGDRPAGNRRGHGGRGHR